MGRVHNWFKENFHTKIFLISTLVAMFSLVPVLSNRFVSFFGLTVLLGVLWMAVAFNISDMINYFYGKKVARMAIVTAAGVRMLTWLLIVGGLMLPMVRETVGFESVIKTGIWNLIAAELALVLSQYFIDIPMFDWIKQKTLVGKFVVPAFFSNNLTQSISTLIFLFVREVGLGDYHHMWNVIWNGVLSKFLLSIILTLVFALMVWLIKPMVKDNGRD